MTTQEQRAEWRELADVLGKYAEPPDDARYEARDAITALLAERDALAASWQQEHTERVRLEERLKAAEQRAEALRAQLVDEPEPMLYKASTHPLWTDDTPTPGAR